MNSKWIYSRSRLLRLLLLRLLQLFSHHKQILLLVAVAVVHLSPDLFSLVAIAVSL